MICKTMDIDRVLTRSVTGEATAGQMGRPGEGRRRTFKTRANGEKEPDMGRWGKELDKQRHLEGARGPSGCLEHNEQGCRGAH